MGRVVIDDAATVGVQYVKKPTDTYNSTLPVGRQIKIEQGEKQTLWAYNGDVSGSITFTLAFRNARYILENTLLVISTSVALLMLSQ